MDINYFSLYPNFFINFGHIIKNTTGGVIAIKRPIPTEPENGSISGLVNNPAAITVRRGAYKIADFVFTVN